MTNRERRKIARAHMQRPAEASTSPIQDCVALGHHDFEPSRANTGGRCLHCQTEMPYGEWLDPIRDYPRGSETPR